MEDKCVTCQHPVLDEDRAIECSFCNVRGHQTVCTMKWCGVTLCHCCMCARVAVERAQYLNGLFSLRKSLHVLTNSGLLSARLIEEREALIRELRQQNAELLAQYMTLQEDILKLSQQFISVKLQQGVHSILENKPSAERSLSISVASDGPPS